MFIVIQGWLNLIVCLHPFINQSNSAVKPVGFGHSPVIFVLFVTVKWNCWKNSTSWQGIKRSKDDQRFSLSPMHYYYFKKQNKIKQNKESPRLLWAKIFMILKNILVFQSTDKKVLFGYWSSFIPDNTMSASWSLFTIILKDPTPKVGIFSIK